MKNQKEKFSGMINALSFGAPHGGIAPGIDRIVMLLQIKKYQRSNLFPMNQNAQDLMMNAPSKVDPVQLKRVKY